MPIARSLSPGGSRPVHGAGPVGPGWPRARQTDAEHERDGVPRPPGRGRPPSSTCSRPATPRSTPPSTTSTPPSPRSRPVVDEAEAARTAADAAVRRRRGVRSGPPTRRRLLQAAIREMAIASYVHPPTADLVRSLQAHSFSDVLLQRAYLDARARRDVDLLDLLELAETTATASGRAQWRRRRPRRPRPSRRPQPALRRTRGREGPTSRPSRSGSRTASTPRWPRRRRWPTSMPSWPTRSPPSRPRSSPASRRPTARRRARRAASHGRPRRRRPPLPIASATTVPRPTTPTRHADDHPARGDRAPTTAPTPHRPRPDGAALGGTPPHRCGRCRASPSMPTSPRTSMPSSTAAPPTVSTCPGGGYRSTERQIELRIAHCGPTYYDIWEKSASLCQPPDRHPGSLAARAGQGHRLHRRRPGHHLAVQRRLPVAGRATRPATGCSTSPASPGTGPRAGS